MYYEPNGVQELPQRNPIKNANLPPIPKSALKARTTMLWNAQKTGPYNPMTHSEHDAFLMHEGDDQQNMVNKQITQWERQADYNPAGTDY